MYDRMSVFLGRMLTLDLSDLRREEGQGATEYALVVGFIVVAVAATIGLLGTAITGLLGRVATKIGLLFP